MDKEFRTLVLDKDVNMKENKIECVRGYVSPIH